MLDGKCGEAYNISYEKCDITLKELANIIAKVSGTKVIFDLPDEVEKTGFSTATKAILDNSKIKKLGWKSIYNIEDGIKRTIEILSKK